MKYIFFTVLIASALIINLSSCKKESFSPSTPTTQYPYTINNLVASRWIKDERGHYVSVISNVFLNTKTSNHVVNIYLIANGTETLFNQPMSFMNGKLSIEIMGSDLRLDFLPADDIFPFSYLVIKIVIV